MDIDQNKLSLLPWYSNGERQNDIGNLLDQLVLIVNETSKCPESEEIIAATALKWTERKQGTLYLITSEQKQVIGTIALSPEQGKKNHARFGCLIGKQYVNRGIEAVTLEKLLPLMKKKGFTNVSGSRPDGEISYISQWKDLGLIIAFDEEDVAS